jgi:DNA-binding transcriptional ArsR family regulator
MTRSNGDPPLSLDELFDILRNARRRHVVELLDESGGEAEFRDLTDAVARRETGNPVSYDARKRVYVSLRQSHLPRLAEAGVVEYDRDRGTVRATPLFDTVVRPLEAVTERLDTQVGADD